tara:strand:- start:127 stop:462 length:336 start_codon:yes stop_codon:yes gene_type:complete
MRFIGVIIIIAMVVGAIATVDYTKFIDLPSLLIVLGGAMGYVLAKGKSNAFIKDFGDGSVYMGWIGLFIGFIIIGNHHADAEKIGPAISIAFLPIFYGYFFQTYKCWISKK